MSVFSVDTMPKNLQKHPRHSNKRPKMWIGPQDGCTVQLYREPTVLINANTNPCRSRQHNKRSQPSPQLQAGSGAQLQLVQVPRINPSMQLLPHINPHSQAVSFVGNRFHSTEFHNITEKAEKKVELGANITFLIDISGSMSGSKIRAVEEGLIGLCKQLHKGDFISIIGFNRTATVLFQGFAQKACKNDCEEIRNLHLRTLTNYCTAMRDAIKFAIDERESYERKNPKILSKLFQLFCLTDGCDNISKLDEATAKAMLLGAANRNQNFHFEIVSVDVSNEEAASNHNLVKNCKRCKHSKLGNCSIEDLIRTSFLKEITKNRVVAVDKCVNIRDATQHEVRKWKQKTHTARGT